MFALVETRDVDFDWLVGVGDGRDDIRLPPGGVDAPETLAIVREIHRAARDAGRPGAWMMVWGDEVVGLCGAVRAPDDPGEMEIGYGVAPSRRRLGHATRAVATIVALARADGALRSIAAVTAVDNLASQGALTRNGFWEATREHREDDGWVIIWRLTLS